LFNFKEYQMSGLFNYERKVLWTYRVYLQECVDSDFSGEILFECQAEDMQHAIEQTRDAYPDCRINYPACHRNEWFITAGYVETIHWDEHRYGFKIRLSQTDEGNFIYVGEEWRDGGIVMTHDVATYQECREWIGQEFLAHCQNRYSLIGLCDLWNALSEVPVTDEDQLEQPFEFFPKGTALEEVRHWFESVMSEFSAGLLPEKNGANLITSCATSF
jgi:hypothetical protein